ncbi:coiled-coil domain-containing protein 43 [Bombus affinis]|uniref:Coiled-coil domain-containing protein 43 n=1 Tax=Bombus terrestris TaxID=30195 RepID=A0A9B2JP39_BOMTE|nr:coiled-coil domain-containing protein 43 [Bombus terrestris]XP_012164919.1 coiled-coil domain-containing protein 43 [Bombus terrestris]XP_012164920.1 coiled-coil domain-containing protein 43 [Bombus terrestris]XP_048262479.1 coiled-coil domain-containing protein 43 [Bombus terrestris]XP_050576611.1 coiled-coil domain-containing protein 43 [Bombus affinis]XP_050576612.1 coiled-coil domain-containing protein 43 [Bombus affinis]XP_050576613.1 coiled-coil domain-containing protein 43 [Bombus a
MAVATNSFDTWLSKKLQALNTDEGVFGSYIKGILEGDETEDEKTEALEVILAGITDDNISKLVTEILKVWAECLPVEEVGAPKVPVEDVDVRLARMLESQSLPTTTQRSYTEEERRIREAILAQYSQMSEEENSEGDGEEDGANGGDCGIEKNTNTAAIIQQEREKREKAKLESQRKKEKDKEDREKQKQLREEKKEKRKTQKGERRR